MRKKDYERAYSYLSPELPGYPDTVERFVDHVDTHVWTSSDAVSLKVEDVTITGNRAVVTVSETSFGSGGLFESSQWTNRQTLRLARETEEWKLIASDLSWYDCWSDLDRCDGDLVSPPEPLEP
jgi:hypothetical protein